MFSSISNAASQVSHALCAIPTSLYECLTDCSPSDEFTPIIIGPLFLAINNKNMSKDELDKFEKTLEVLPKRISTPIQVGFSTETLLHRGAKVGNLAVLHILLEGKFIDINAPGVLHSHRNSETLKNMTPLMFAVYSAVYPANYDDESDVTIRLDAAKLLVEHGADIYAKNSKGETAFMIWERSSIGRSAPHWLCEDHELQNFSDRDRLLSSSVSAAAESKYSENLTHLFC